MSIDERKQRILALGMNRQEQWAIAGLIAMLCQLLLGTEGKNWRKFQQDWNKHADNLDGRVPSFPKKKLLR